MATWSIDIYIRTQWTGVTLSVSGKKTSALEMDCRVSMTREGETASGKVLQINETIFDHGVGSKCNSSPVRVATDSCTDGNAMSEIHKQTRPVLGIRRQVPLRGGKYHSSCTYRGGATAVQDLIGTGATAQLQ